MAASDIEIRPSEERDLASFHACLDTVTRERRWLGMVQAPPLEVVRQFSESGRRHGTVQLVAIENERVIGWCDIRPNPLEGFRHAGELGMGILDGYRERGLGAELLRGTLDRARANGLARVSLEVFASNARAIALYRRFGFAHEGVKHAGRILDGRVEDIVCMALLVRDPQTLLARPFS
jgi:RimJ/RimL family protein N-acetyltransferase